MTRNGYRAVFGLLSGLAVVAFGASPAAAGDGSTPILQVDNLAPGQSTSAVVGVRNQTSKPVRMSVKAFSVRDDDRGCIEPESQAGDDSCGSGGGELSPYLHVMIHRDQERDGSFEAEPAFSGTLDELTAGTSLGDLELPPFSEWDYRVELSIARQAGNVVMSDRVPFDLAWTSTGEAGGPVDPSLVQTVLKPVTETLGVLFTLPVTGSGLGLGHQALGLVGLGLLIRLGSRRRK